MRMRKLLQNLLILLVAFLLPLSTDFAYSDIYVNPDGSVDVDNYEDFVSAIQNASVSSINVLNALSGSISVGSQEPSVLSIYGNSFSISGNSLISGIFIDTGKSLEIVSVSNLMNFIGVDGGVINSQGILSVVDSSFRANSATNGGAIFSTNNLSINNVTFNNNTAEIGGGIYSEGDLVIVNSEFKNNAAINQPNSKGGAIYSKGNVSIYADGSSAETKFEGNYLQTDENAQKDYQAIYMDSDTGVLRLSAQNNGIINFQDSINGQSGYQVSIDGDGSVILLNKVENADIVLTDASLYIGLGNYGVSDFSSSSLDALSGKIISDDSKFSTLNLGKLSSTSNVLYTLDFVLENGILKTDVLNVESGSDGVITIDALNGYVVNFSDVEQYIDSPISVKVLNKDVNDNIVLVLTDRARNKKEKTVFDYLDSSEGTYKLNQDSFVGTVGLSVKDGDSLSLGVVDEYDPLARLNQFVPEGVQPQGDRYFTVADNTTFYAHENTGTTSSYGSMNVLGGTGSVIDYSNNGAPLYGFIVPTGVTLNISDVTFQNAEKTGNGAVINVSGVVNSIADKNFINNKAT